MAAESFLMRWQGKRILQTIPLPKCRMRFTNALKRSGIASTYLVGMNESGNQKGNLSYLAGTKKTVRFFNTAYFS